MSHWSRTTATARRCIRSICRAEDRRTFATIGCRGSIHRTRSGLVLNTAGAIVLTSCARGARKSRPYSLHVFRRIWLFLSRTNGQWTRRCIGTIVHMISTTPLWVRAMQRVPSYVSGTSSVPLIGETIGACFDRIAREHATHDALIVRQQNVCWTYAELADRIDRVAASLLRLGLEPGDRVGIWAPNCAEWVLTQFATAKAGLILVNINPAYRRSELEYALAKVGCKALVLAPGFKSSNYLEILGEIAPELAQCAPGALVAEKLPELRHVIRLGDVQTPGMHNFDALLVE